MAPFSPSVLRSWHALARAGRRLAATASLITAGLAASAAAAAAAAPSVTTRLLAAATGATSAAKPRGKPTTAKTKTRRKAARTARPTTARARNRTRTAATRRSTGRRATLNRPDPAPRVAAEPTLVVPAVDLPNLALATPTASWETALTALPAASPAASAGTAGPLAALSRSATSLLDNLVSRARGQLGTRYVYGAAAPGAGLDCSSFVRYVMEAMNVRLPRTADEQAQAGRAIPRDRAQLRPGDLLTFGRGRRTSHVGIYLGEGRFIHASVSSGRVIETSIDRNQALFRRWQGARRLIAGTEPDSATASSERGG